MSIAGNIRKVREEIAEAAVLSGRSPETVTLIAVSKLHSALEVSEAVDAGIGHLGENRLQEAAEKIPDVSGDPVWHMIGHLQSNKVKRAVDLFPWIDSVDRKKTVDLIEGRCAELGCIRQVLIQVNISGEEAKSGAPPETAADLAGYAATRPHLMVRGLMTIGSLGADVLKRADEFSRMRRLFEDLRGMMPIAGFDQLSMGMSDDFSIAVREGASMVRIGTAIFGTRTG